jgi:hypothetical protein
MRIGRSETADFPTPKTKVNAHSLYPVIGAIEQCTILDIARSCVHDTVIELSAWFLQTEPVSHHGQNNTAVVSEVASLNPKIKRIAPMTASGRTFWALYDERIGTRANPSCPTSSHKIQSEGDSVDRFGFR